MTLILFLGLRKTGIQWKKKKREPSEYDSLTYKELTDLAKERGFNAIGVKKEQLIIELINLDKEGTTDLCETKNADQNFEEAEE